MLSRTGIPVVLAVLALALILVPVSQAKEFKPGDLEVCGSERCVTVLDAKLSAALARHIYTGSQPATVAGPRLGTRYYQLRFAGNGYVAGIVAGPRLGRWLSYGVVLERFTRGQWYSIPPATAAQLRDLTRSLAPHRLDRAAVERSR